MSIGKIQAAAARAQADYDYESAIELYTEALEQLDSLDHSGRDQLECDLRMGRALCCQRLGRYAEGLAENKAAIELAESLDDLPRRIRGLNYQVLQLNDSGGIPQAVESAELALSLARENNENRLLAESLVAQGILLHLQQDAPRLQVIAEELESLLANLDDRRLEARMWTIKGAGFGFAGLAEQANEALQTALKSSRDIGDAENEGYVLNLLGLLAKDLAEANRFYRGSLAIFSNLRYSFWRALTSANLGGAYSTLGLYHQSRYYKELAVQTIRSTESNRLRLFLLSLVGPYIDLEMWDETDQVLEEISELSSEGLPSNFLGAEQHFIGMSHLYQNRPDKALDSLENAAEIYSELSNLRARSLALLAQAHLELGDWPSAYAAATEAIQLLNTSTRRSGGTSSNSQIYWQHFLVLKAEPEGHNEEPWPVLVQAFETMLKDIAYLSDEGLRRNYLNKININRAVVEEWAREAAARGKSLESLTQGTGVLRDFQAQLTRVVETGVRMTTERDPDALPNFIMNEFVELSGVERAFLMLRADGAENDWRIPTFNGIDEETIEVVRSANQHILRDAIDSQQPIWRSDVGHVPERSIPELHLRSVIVLPLTSQGKLLGLLYGDMRQIFGKFEQADLDLLAVLVTQAAAALENANWSRTLEQRVEERTAELAASQKELANQLSFIRTLVDTIPNPIFAKDPDLRYSLFNQAYEEAYGVDAQQMIGKTILDNEILTQEEKELYHAQDKELLKKVGMNHDEFELRYADGELHTILQWVSSFEQSDGTIGGLVGITADISEQKEMEHLLAIANERMSDELNFARDIQLSMLPLIFPAYPNRSEVAIYATLESAREVGGDFYDFYFLDDDHLCFVIGDVSGKGAPGALMMAVSKTLIKSRAADDSEPASILTHVNDEIARDNDSNMFVTVFLGIINVKSGELVYTNAGHNPPYIRRKDGTLQKVDAFHGPVVGAMPGLPYQQDADRLNPGDLILIFTDGVTEAFNEEEDLFSEERLEAILPKESFNSAENLVMGTLAEVNRFVGDAEPSDDVTLLAVQYLGLPQEVPSQELQLTIKNRFEDMEIVDEQFSAFAEENNLADSIRQSFSIVLDEMLNNIISYAYQGEKGKEIEINLDLSGNRLVLVIKDGGVPFNPFKRETPDLSESIEEREIGGLGIHMVRSLMDEVSYQRQINNNVVTLVKLIDG